MKHFICASLFDLHKGLYHDLPEITRYICGRPRIIKTEILRFRCLALKMPLIVHTLFTFLAHLGDILLPSQMESD